MYLPPKADLLELKNEGIICSSNEGEGEDYTWD